MTHADDWPPENIFEKAIRYRGIGTDHIALSKFKQGSNSIDSLNGSFSGKQQPTSNILSSRLFQLSLSTDWGSDPLFFFLVL
jgi:hypothetical protein